MIRSTLHRAAAGAGIAALLAAGGTLAHHGFVSYDTENPIMIEGFVSEEMDGFPHWEINVRSEGQDWTVDVGNDFTLQRAGLASNGSDFQIGREIRIEGYRVTDPGWYHIAPFRITLDGDKVHDIEVDID
ncbi:MAG: DUF6152 family protein [Pseudomonadota bacterium]